MRACMAWSDIIRLCLTSPYPITYCLQGSILTICFNQHQTSLNITSETIGIVSLYSLWGAGWNLFLSESLFRWNSSLYICTFHVPMPSISHFNVFWQNIITPIISSGCTHNNTCHTPPPFEVFILYSYSPTPKILYLQKWLHLILSLGIKLLIPIKNRSCLNRTRECTVEPSSKKSKPVHQHVINIIYAQYNPA